MARNYKKLHAYRYLFLLIILSLVCYLIYLPAFRVGFLSDDYYALYTFKIQGLRIFFGPEDLVFMPLMMLVTGILYKLFGMQPLMYHVFILAVHVLNAFLLSLFTERLLRHFKLLEGRIFMVASLTALFFAVNPYHTEAVTWISSIGYVLSLCLCLACMLVFLQWMQKRRFSLLLLSGLLFLFATFAKEVALALPAALVLMFIADQRINKGGSFRSLFPKTFIPTFFFLLLIVMYFLMRHYFIGEYIGHYGVHSHLGFTVKSIITGLFIYITKFFTAYRFLPRPIHDALQFIIHHPYISGIITGLIFIFIYFRRRQWKEKLLTAEMRLAGFFFIIFLLSLIPVLNLELSFLSDIQSDRYGYFSSLFFALTAVFMLLAVTGRRPGFFYVIMLLTILWFSFLTLGENKKWERCSVISEKFYSSLKEKKVSAQNIYLVNVPDTYKGAYVARCGVQEGMLLHGICDSCEVHILSYMAILNDGASVSCIPDGDCLMLRNKDGAIKLYPDPHVEVMPGFSYYAASQGFLRICLDGELPANSVVFIVNPDGSVIQLTK